MFLHRLRNQSMKSSRSEFVPIRNLRYHVRHWGSPDAPKLFMLHGWMDVSASFQFVVDCLRQDWHVIAPDWRGFGLTEFSGTDCYWFPDYLGDLDALIRHYSASEPIHLLGHSMGGNVACVYAGVRPTRINKLVNLEGFGLPAAVAEQAPGRYAKWLDELQHPPGLRSYANRDEVAARLQKTNPRLTDARAAFLAGHWAAPDEQGEWHVLGDPAHRMVNPVLYRLDEILACWRRIAARGMGLDGRERQGAP
jgi:pimeloyl-ACP methyl ester carboxylesterase